MPERPSLTIGVEEEYLIVDRSTRDLVDSPADGFMDRCAELTSERSTPEYLQCQVEIGTAPHARIADVREDLLGLRRAIAEAANEYGYAPIAASTHPFAKWRQQHHTPKPRYDELRADIGQPVRRMLICGCHVHCAVEDDDLRIDLMNQAAYFLPHLLALSCSSPFWEGEDTGLASYRLTVFDAMPRTGLPDILTSHSEYRRLVDALVGAGAIEDATKIWWDIRPSDKFPTLEQRVTDVCGTVDEAATVAALYQCLMSYLYRLRTQNLRWRVYPNTLIMENRWRAQRYGVGGKLIDHGKTEAVPYTELAEELVSVLLPEAEALRCTAELANASRVADRGTSSMRQRAVHAKAIEGGASGHEAGMAVVDHLISEFTAGSGLSHSA